VKPTKIVLFILIILGGMLSLAFFFPKEGIKITDDWVLHFPTIDELLDNSEKKVVDITEIIQKNQVPEDSLDTDTEQDLASALMDDSTIIYYDPVEINPDEVTRKLEYPANNIEVLYPFFKELSEVKSNGKLIRILHYGDSQIEADRISSYLRHKLQGQFGGSGPGLIPPVQPYGFKAPVIAEYSEGWKRFPGFGKRDSAIAHNRYGVLASFGMYTKNKKDSDKDSTEVSEPEVFNEWLQFEHSPYAYRNVKKYFQCRMFYAYNKFPVKFKLIEGETELRKEILNPSTSLQVKKWNFEKTPGSLRLVFEGKDSPEVYALALDGGKGVAVDNIPLRGSTGIVFTNSDTEMLSAIYQNLNAKLLILQFGGNAAPSMRDDYKYYERSFYNQLSKLKRLIPGVSIIVVGIADMSQKDKDQYVSLPNVTLIRDALKKAAFKADCAFWDTYEAMGGENSMSSWVFNDPPLAEKDFTHFTVQGSKIIAQMFYKALMLEYKNYFNSTIKKNKPEGGNVQLSSK
jgi:lysophospholipase L1-like esterase